MLPLVGGEAGEEYTAQDAASEVARLRARIEDLQRQLGRLEGRLELTERTESTLREDLERERRQSLEEVQRERAERLEAQKTAKALERDRIRLEWERFYREARQKELEDALDLEEYAGPPFLFVRRLPPTIACSTGSRSRFGFTTGAGAMTVSSGMARFIRFPP